MDPNKDMQERLKKVMDINLHKRDLQESAINQNSRLNLKQENPQAKHVNY